MIKSLESKTNLLKLIKRHLDIKSLATVGGGLINSTILYGAPVWSSTTKANTDRLQKAQCRAARAITGWGWKNAIKLSRQDMLNKLGWPNVLQLRNTAILNLTHNAISNNSSAGMNKMFKVTLPSHPRSGTSQYINHSGPIDRSSSTFSSLSTSLYNNLPVELKIPMISTKTFKTKVGSYNLSINTLISNK